MLSKIIINELSITLTPLKSIHSHRCLNDSEHNKLYRKITSLIFFFLHCYVLEDDFYSMAPLLPRDKQSCGVSMNKNSEIRQYKMYIYNIRKRVCHRIIHICVTGLYILFKATVMLPGMRREMFTCGDLPCVRQTNSHP